MKVQDLREIPHEERINDSIFSGKKNNNENLPSAVQAWKGLQQTEAMIEVLVHNIFSSI